MKNFFLIMMAMTFALTSCGGNTEETAVEETTVEEAPTVETDSTAVEIPATDSAQQSGTKSGGI